MTDWVARSRKKPFEHQVEGVRRLSLASEPEVGRIYPGAMLLADQMRLGKTKQVIDTAQLLFERGQVDTVIVVCPNPVRDVWYDEELGEIQKHMWEGVPNLVVEYHVKIRKWARYIQSADKPYLTWIITNFEYIRHAVSRSKSRGWVGPNLEPLVVKYAKQKTWFVIDESAAIASYDSLQTRACTEIRKRCGWVTELNGTPLTQDPESLYSQFKVLDPRIFGIDHVSGFRSRYAIMGGHVVKVMKFGREIPVAVEVLGWRHRKAEGCCEIPDHITSPVHGPGPGLEEIQEKIKPYIIRRMRKDCFDLPPKLDAVTLTATLTRDTWRIYKEMRDLTVSWLTQNKVATAAQAAVKVMRLCQITSGYLGGVRDEAATCPECGGSGQAPLGENSLLSDLNLGTDDCLACAGSGTLSAALPAQEVGREKLDLFLTWVKKRIVEEPNMRMITWCRFRPELERCVYELNKIGGLRVRAIYGGQDNLTRLEGLRLMHPDTPPYVGPAVLAGTLGTGGVGLNMAGGHEMVFQANNGSLYQRLQTEDRPCGLGQTEPISYHDIVAVGPNGQHTTDHIILLKLKSRIALERWTTAAWVEALTSIQ